VICFQQSIDGVGKSHSADNASINLSGYFEGMFCMGKGNASQLCVTVSHL